MALKNYTTTKGVHETVGEIHVMLAKHGAQKIMFDYQDDGRIEAICFSVKTPSGSMAVKLPAYPHRVQEVLTRQKAQKTARSTAAIDASYEQSERVAWRIVKDWLDAQLALLETEMVDMPQVFLPYFVDRSGRTFYEEYQAGHLLIGDGERREERV